MNCFARNRLSLRQTAASIGLLVLYLVAAKDAFISRIFLFNFVPWLYIALLFSHHYLPSLLARGISAAKTKRSWSVRANAWRNCGSGWSAKRKCVAHSWLNFR